MKLEQQTHMEPLSSCRSGLLVVLVLLNLQFSVFIFFVFVIFCSVIIYLSFLGRWCHILIEIASPWTIVGNVFGVCHAFCRLMFPMAIKSRGFG